MERKALGALATLLTAAPLAVAAQSAGPPTSDIYIMDEEVKTVLEGAPPAVDQQLRVVDMGEYQLAVGIVHRGPSAPAGAAFAPFQPPLPALPLPSPPAARAGRPAAASAGSTTTRPPRPT